MPQVLLEHEKSCSGRRNFREIAKKCQNQFGFNCLDCGHFFVKKEYLWKHIKSVHNRQEMIECKQCDKVFNTNGGLIYHLKTIHMGFKRNFTCDICGKIYQNKQVVARHKLLVHSKDFKIICQVCQRGFFSENELKKHIQTFHEAKELLPCPIEGCNKIFQVKESLKYHVETVHNPSEDKPDLICVQCGKLFNHPKSLKNHMHQHRRCKTFPCSVCGKILTSQASLRDHLRIHTGERPFICELCSQEFSKLQSLKNHMVVHTKEKRFSCKLCDTQFTQRGPLARHMQRFHPDVQQLTRRGTQADSGPMVAEECDTFARHVEKSQPDSGSVVDGQQECDFQFT
ncbi:unnamed protein product [Ceutorhynchus assimilis]|uniref:Zinc finger protein n=1 Tax=Ceutorhynchus assimilis TaxID=467358 RepID=A0A9N9QL28_9CUCU|nr:unnamed protein product [Ceutorhynchus assimilis]